MRPSILLSFSLFCVLPSCAGQAPPPAPPPPVAIASPAPVESISPPALPLTTRPAYPASRRVDQVDVLHGVTVPDPYRWLEDGASAEVHQWADAQDTLA